MKKVLILIVFFLSLSNSFAEALRGAVILYDRSSVTFYASGKKVWKEEKAIKITNYRGIKEFGEIVIPFSSEHQRVKILYAYTQLPNGKKIFPSKKAFNIVYPPFRSEAPIYSDLKYQTISMPAVSKGAIIKYGFQIETFKPFMKGEFWAENYFQDEYPVKEATFIAKIPVNKKFRFKQYNMDNVKPEIKKGKKFIRYKWTLKDIPPIDREPNMPPMDEIAKKVVISSVESWDKVASWYSNLSRKALEPNKALRKLSLKLTKDLKTEREKIREIYNFVAQNIRYVGMEFGINGYKPHKAIEVLKNRYGDCKDHATLLIAMLKAIGIKAYPVLIPTINIADLDTDIPKPTSFNHEIAAVNLGNKFIFLDTTDDVVPFGELPPGDQGRRVLIIDEGKAIISRTPVFPPNSNIEGFNGKFKLSEEGELEGTFQFIYKGVYAELERHRFKSSTVESRRRHIEELASKISPGFDVDSFEITNFNDLNRKTIKVTISGNDKVFGTKTEHMMLVHVPAPNYSRIVNLVASKTRKYPYVVGYKMMKESFVELKIPREYKLFFIPEPFYYRNSVGSLKAEWMKLNGDTLKFHSKLVLTNEKIPPDKYQELRDLFNLTVKSIRNQIVVLKRKE